MTLNIVLSGYGRMGKETEKAALAKGHRVVATPDSLADWQLMADAIATADVVIDFSLPDAAGHNAERALALGKPFVTGTTGWNPDYDYIRQLVARHGGAFLMASNFSVGVNILFHVQKQMAELLADAGGYRAVIEETHHIHKKDAPSGTAIRLANDLVATMPPLQRWENNPSTDREVLPVISYRQGEVPGTHVTTFTSANDVLTLKHEALGRGALAAGAVLAAEWIAGRQGIFTFEEVLGLSR